MDIWGPFGIPSTSGHRYFLTVVDDKSRFTWIYFLKHKSEVPELIKNFISLVQTQFSLSVKCIRSDNGKEFSLCDLYAKKGIEHQTSCVETPQQNGAVERKHQHILGVARSLIFQSKIPHCFWNYVITHAIYLINRQPSSYLSNRSPYSSLYEKLPNIHYLKVFGCLCYATTITSHRKKFDPRSRKGVYLGLKGVVKGYVILDINTHEIFISRNVSFYEHIFPYKETNDTDQDHNLIMPANISQEDPVNISEEFITHYGDNEEFITHNGDNHDSDNMVENNEYNSQIASEHINTNDIGNPRKSHRIKHRPHYLSNYHCSLLSFISHSLSPRSSKERYPLSHSISYDHLSSAHKHFTLAISSNVEPNTFNDTIKQTCWRDAIEKELKALSDNNTWTLTTLPNNKKAIGCK
ncbi:putative RNA-directed DNA polymerase [Lupinus albus]|uniref:Putative RNA-directed DNA polymerase n=1 Tax=Lupinus albus TaxID=3870 RepID=A0A6A4P1T5_LUPAL|nr:putative RNA-directed DNA polymerase [Lupinus albus]